VNHFSKSKANSISCIVMAISSITLVGCQAPSLLVTPVSGSRKLVETELSRDSFFASDKIAIIHASGVLMNSAKPQLLGSGEHAVSLIREQLDKARRDSSVKAVILRINSPGGTVVASELIHDEILQFKKSGKPIVAVMMDVAASGGYYIACACDDIIAQPSTVTGSIGVIMQLFDMSGTLGKLGIKNEAITSGPNKEAGSPFRSLSPQHRKIFQQIVDDMYGRFVDVVVAGRPKLDEAAVRKLADGRVFTGTQAVKVGLVDRIATMRDTIAALKAQKNITSARVVTYHRPAEYKPNYYANMPQPGIDINLLNIDAAGLLAHASPEFLYLWAPSIAGQ